MKMGSCLPKRMVGLTTLIILALGVFRPACERAGVRYLRIHDVRHTYASHFVMNGGSIHVLQKLLGHSQIRTTEAYSHLSNAYVREASNLVHFGKS